MEMKELERIIDERSKAQSKAVADELKKELGNGVTQAQIDEAVAKAVAEINAKAEKEKTENVKYLEAFKDAVTSKGENFVKETPVTIVNQMIASATSAMGAKGAHNVTQVSAEDILTQAKKDFPYSKGLHKVLEQKNRRLYTFWDYSPTHEINALKSHNLVYAPCFQASHRSRSPPSGTGSRAISARTT